MKQVKIYSAVFMLLFSTASMAQSKDAPPPPPDVVAPPTPEIKGYPWTRNGENVWVVKTPKKVIVPIPAIPPPPPPPPAPPAHADKD